MGVTSHFARTPPEVSKCYREGGRWATPNLGTEDAISVLKPSDSDVAATPVHAVVNAGLGRGRIPDHPPPAPRFPSIASLPAPGTPVGGHAPGAPLPVPITPPPPMHETSSLSKGVLTLGGVWGSTVIQGRNSILSAHSCVFLSTVSPPPPGAIHLGGGNIRDLPRKGSSRTSEWGIP